MLKTVCLLNKRRDIRHTLDDYYSFMEEFPKSQYSKDVNSIFQKTNKYLKTEIPESGVK